MRLSSMNCTYELHWAGRRIVRLVRLVQQRGGRGCRRPADSDHAGISTRRRTGECCGQGMGDGHGDGGLTRSAETDDGNESLIRQLGRQRHHLLIPPGYRIQEPGRGEF